MDANKCLPESTDECNVCDEEPEQGIILRCSVCKNQFYCSKKCQKQDWPKHKFNCSLLPPDGLSPAQSEDHNELRAEANRVSVLLIEWKKAFTSLKEEKGVEGTKGRGGRLPEAGPIERLEISPRFAYSRLPQHHDSCLFRTPLILAARILFMDLIATLSPGKLEMLMRVFKATQFPSDMPQLYGPKMVARPGDLSPGEYEMLATILVAHSLGESGAVNEAGGKDRWISLAVAMKTLFNIRRATKKVS